MQESFERNRSSIDTADAVRLSERGIDSLCAIAQQLESTGYLATKIQAKQEVKDRMAYDDGTNDWDCWKRLGMFLVHEMQFTTEITKVLINHGVDIYADESVLELHIPPQDANKEDRVKSIVRFAEYLKANAKERTLPRIIYGVSYFASKAKDFGFEVVDLPASLRKSSGAARLLERYSGSADPKLKAIAKHFSEGDIKLCYISTDDFIDFAESMEGYMCLKQFLPTWIAAKAVLANENPV